MDYYTKCLKQVLFSELSHLEIKERLYKEIYDKSFDEYMLKKNEIEGKIALIEKEKNGINTRVMKKIAVLVPVIVFFSGIALLSINTVLSSLGINAGVDMILALIITLSVVLPVSYKTFIKEYNNRDSFNENKDMEIKKLKDELKKYEEIMEKEQSDYLDVSLMREQLQDEIDALDDLDVSCEIDEDKEIITVSKKPYTRKLEK